MKTYNPQCNPPAEYIIIHQQNKVANTCPIKPDNFLMTYKCTSHSEVFKETYLLKPGTSQNDTKPANMSCNQPQNNTKTAKTIQKIVKQLKTTQNFKIGETLNFLIASVFQTSSPNAQMTLVLTNYKLKCPILGILGQEALPF